MSGKALYGSQKLFHGQVPLLQLSPALFALNPPLPLEVPSAPPCFEELPPPLPGGLQALPLGYPLGESQLLCPLTLLPSFRP